MSRSGAAEPRVRPGRSGFSPSNLVWHTSCIASLAGCLYTAPVWRGEVNQKPIVISPENGDQDVLLFSDTPVIVVAADPDGDDLVFLWSAPGHPDLPSTERTDADLTTSTAILPFEPELDGQDAECLVVDQSEDFNVARVTFHLEVP